MKQPEINFEPMEKIDMQKILKEVEKSLPQIERNLKLSEDAQFVRIETLQLQFTI